MKKSRLTSSVMFNLTDDMNIKQGYYYFLWPTITSPIVYYCQMDQKKEVHHESYEKVLLF